MIRPSIRLIRPPSILIIPPIRLIRHLLDWLYNKLYLLDYRIAGAFTYYFLVAQNKKKKKLQWNTENRKQINNIGHEKPTFNNRKPTFDNEKGYWIIDSTQTADGVLADTLYSDKPLYLTLMKYVKTIAEPTVHLKQ